MNDNNDNTPRQSTGDTTATELPDGRLKRDISRLGFNAININSVIGAGIFGLPAVAAARAGDFSPWMFVICGLLTFTLVLSFARAASLVRETGGALLYARKAFGSFVGFQTGWLSWLSRVAAMGANTNLLVTYAAWFWAPLGDSPWRQVALTVVIGSMTWLNVAGVRNSMAAIYAFTILKLLPLSLLVLFGLGKIDVAALFGAEMPALGSFGSTVLVLLYAFVGFEGTVVNAGEARSPRRDLPRALIQSITFIAVLYFLVQWVSQATLPDLASSERALVDVATVLFGSIGAALLTMGAVFSIGGNLMGSVLSAPRMTWAMARDGSLPPWFAAVHDRYHTPHHSVLFYGATCLLMALTGSFVWLAMMSTLVRLIAYMVVIAGLPRLKQRAEAHADEFNIPGGMFIPILALALCLWLLTGAGPRAWAVTGVFFVLGCGLYLWSKRQ